MRAGTGGSHSINSNIVIYQEYGFRKEDILTGEKVQGGEMLKKYDLQIVSVPRA